MLEPLCLYAASVNGVPVGNIAGRGEAATIQKLQRLVWNEFGIMLDSGIELKAYLQYRGWPDWYYDVAERLELWKIKQYTEPTTK